MQFIDAGAAGLFPGALFQQLTSSTVLDLFGRPEVRWNVPSEVTSSPSHRFDLQYYPHLPWSRAIVIHQTHPATRLLAGESVLGLLTCQHPGTSKFAPESGRLMLFHNIPCNKQPLRLGSQESRTKLWCSVCVSRGAPARSVSHGHPTYANSAPTAYEAPLGVRPFQATVSGPTQRAALLVKSPSLPRLVLLPEGPDRGSMCY